MPKDEFGENPFKKELIEGLEKDSQITAYRQGDFFDLCRGPHLPTLGKIKAFKVLKTSGAYWRGDEKNKQLTRIYGITFPKAKELTEYLEMLEEAKKRELNVFDATCTVGKNHIERNQCVLHPECRFMGKRVDKQHPLPQGHFCSPHQTFGTVAMGLGHLNRKPGLPPCPAQIHALFPTGRIGRGDRKTGQHGQN